MFLKVEFIFCCCFSVLIDKLNVEVFMTLYLDQEAKWSLGPRRSIWSRQIMPNIATNYVAEATDYNINI